MADVPTLQFPTTQTPSKPVPLSKEYQTAKDFFKKEVDKRRLKYNTITKDAAAVLDGDMFTKTVKPIQDAQWTASFKTPHLSTDQFEKVKQKYNQQFGYTIFVPGVEDIIHLGTGRPLTPQEEIYWKKKDYSKFTPARIAEIHDIKNLKKQRFLAMLGSPSPQILRNAGAILTSIDNAQDALTTLSILGRLAIMAAPRILSKFMGGPLKWIMTAADVLNVAMAMARTLTLPKQTKHNGEMLWHGNPFGKYARLKRAQKLMRKWPTVGEMIEMSQTTDNIWGVGLSLGPIVGFMQDLVAGAVRNEMGQKVDIKKAPPHTSPALYPAAGVQKAMTLIAGSGYRPDDELLLQLAASHYLSTQEILSNSEGWNALDEVDGITRTQISVPVPTSVLLLEVLNEEDPGHEFFGGWPHHNQQWAMTDDIVKNYAPACDQWMNQAMIDHQGDWLGHVLGNLFTDTHMQTMACLEGEDQVMTASTEPVRIMLTMANAGIMVDPNQPQEKIDQLRDFMTLNQRIESQLNLKSYLQFMATNGIKTIKIT